MRKPFTLHIRLTKACNANCTYCSSFQENPDKYMSVDDFKKSITGFWDRVLSLGININHLTIEYVGGEILLVPQSVFQEQVDFARDFFAGVGVAVMDGAQTNLIASREKVLWLNNLFSGRVGTSIDSFTDQRRINGDSKRYRVIMLNREKSVLENRAKFPGVFTVDHKSLPHANSELVKASREKRNLTIRPAFLGGTPGVEHVTPEEFGGVMVESFSRWFLRMNIVVEPHLSLFRKRLNSHYRIDSMLEASYCSFQNDCTNKSMSIEPNGDLYVCQELADKGFGRLGNAITGEWDNDVWSLLSLRSRNLSEDCLSCEYFAECQGGCMMHSIESGKGVYGKPDYCKSWKMLFSAYDEAIKSTEKSIILKWLSIVG